MNEKINLWIFWYNENTWESTAFPMSYHKTKKGATEAMKKHKQTELEKWNKHANWLIDWNIKNGFSEKVGLSKFGESELWKVDKFELEILP